jgi:hypothetical protein
MHVLLIGPTGCGKTVTLEDWIRQDIKARRGGCVIDPMGPLFDRLAAYCAYCKAIGCPGPEIILLNASDGDWVLPVNPCLKREGELSVQVDRRVSATLRSWGQHSGDETPRLEKWLRCLYTVLIEANLTITDAGYLLDQRASEVRSFIMRGLSDPFIKSRLDQLMRATPREFAEQTESLENRLMRFLCSRHLTRIFGQGSSAIDCRELMDQGKLLLVKAKPSNYFSREQQRLLVTLLLNELFETALERPSGARPFYCYVDEAAQFLTVELAEALEETRQKGLHFILAFQHLAQFKELGIRVYKALKNNVRNKLVFAIPDREDASELADDLIVGLAEPKVKFVHRHLNHLIQDVREKSMTKSSGTTQSQGESESRNQSLAQGISASNGRSFGQSHGREVGGGKARTFTRGRNSETGTSTGHTHSEHEAHSTGFSETNSRQSNFGENSSESTHELLDKNALFGGYEQSSRSHLNGRSSNDSTSHSRTDTGSDSYDSGDSYTETSNTSKGGSTSLACSRNQQQSENRTLSVNFSRQTDRSTTRNQGSSIGSNHEFSRSQNQSITDQPGTRHLPFWEKDPEHWTLEERRWQAAELFMLQRTGHWFVRTASGVMGFGSTVLPKKFFIRPKQLADLTQFFYEQHSLPTQQADDVLARRKRQLVEDARFALDEQLNGQEGSRRTTPTQAGLWNRAASARQRLGAAADAPAQTGAQTRTGIPRPGRGDHPPIRRELACAGAALENLSAAR